MHKKEPKISVIIPMYNSNYVKEAVDSVINQTLQDIEIIIVDDGSTDDSLQICKKNYSNNKRVKILQNESNLGSAFARNKGLDVATGKYICFLDSDDILLPQACQSFYKTATKFNADVVASIGFLVSETADIINNKKGYFSLEATQVSEDVLIPPPPYASKYN